MSEIYTKIKRSEYLNLQNRIKRLEQEKAALKQEKAALEKKVSIKSKVSKTVETKKGIE